MQRFTFIYFIAIVVLGILGIEKTQARTFYLASRNEETPFPYLLEGTRNWPILRNMVPDGSKFYFTARVNDKVVSKGEVINVEAISITVDNNNRLVITAQKQKSPLSLSLDIQLTFPGGTSEQQTLSLLPAPPPRPLSLNADFGDDLISIFNTPLGSPDDNNGWAHITKDAFDQYFRRCQLQGIDRLIMWMSPMPYIIDSANYAPKDWLLYRAQVTAMVESSIFNEHINQQRKLQQHLPWDWVRQLNIYRLMRNFGSILSESAVDHGVKLTISFRPFETALTKYYELPAFDERGNYLWGFLPMATPVINYKTSQTAFAHYRTILEKMGESKKGKIGRISIAGVTDPRAFLKRFRLSGDNIRITASNYPPLRPGSLVLRRKGSGFKLEKFGDFEALANEKLKPLKKYKISINKDTVHIYNINVSSDVRYLILSNPSDAEECLDFPTFEPVKLFAQAGNAIGRENVYWVLDSDDSLSSQTRVPGIPFPNVEDYGTEFNTTEDGYRHLYKQGDARTKLRNRLLVIDLGASYSVEMLDLNQPLMRENVIKEMKTMLDLPAFDELFVNTRSHVSLSAYQADGDEGVKPLVYYRQKKKGHQHLGIDRAYAPLAVANDSLLRRWAKDPELVERITTWQPGEWDGYSQREDSPYRWRYARNKSVSEGVRLLLEDFEAAFPNVRTRILMPMSESSSRRVIDRIETLEQSKPLSNKSRNKGHIWSTINYIHSIGEGMAMVDLTGLKTEPVFFGVRDIPDTSHFNIYFEESLRDFSNNRGSTFRGPRSFFFEAQYTLRGRGKEYDLARRGREELICKVLSFKEDVKEVILYEACDWLYKFPFNDLDLTGNYFIESCGTTGKE